MLVSTEAPLGIREWKFQTEQVILLPYVEDNNASGEALPETVLATLYQKTKDQDLIERVFPAMEKPATLNRFIAHMYGKPLILGFLKGEVNQLIGYGWLYDICGNSEERRAWSGFCFFKEAWGNSALRDLCHLAFKWGFEQLKIRVLYGSILSGNKLARKFAIESGWSLIGTAPSFLSDGTRFYDVDLLCMTKQRWLEEVSNEKL